MSCLGIQTNRKDTAFFREISSHIVPGFDENMWRFSRSMITSYLAFVHKNLREEISFRGRHLPLFGSNIKLLSWAKMSLDRDQWFWSYEVQTENDKTARSMNVSGRSSLFLKMHCKCTLNPFLGALRQLLCVFSEKKSQKFRSETTKNDTNIFNHGE